MTDSRSNRREFLQTAAVAGMTLAGTRVSARESAVQSPYRPAGGFKAASMETVRIGFVGVGLQGGSHVQNFLGIEGVEIVAVCDVDEPRAREVAGWVVAAGRPEPDSPRRAETTAARASRLRLKSAGTRISVKIVETTSPPTTVPDDLIPAIKRNRVPPARWLMINIDHRRFRHPP